MRTALFSLRVPCALCVSAVIFLLLFGFGEVAGGVGEDYGSDHEGGEGREHLDCIARILPGHEAIASHRDGDAGHEEIDRRNREDQHAATDEIFFFHVSPSRAYTGPDRALEARVVWRVLNLEGPYSL